MTSSICVLRLRRELQELRDSPLPGFVIHPAPVRIGSREIDMMHWIVGIPGLEGGDWAGCTLRLDMYFKDQFPSKPPKCQFIPPLYHPNIYPSGSVCLSLLNEDVGWSPSITIRDLLLGIQKLLDEYNLSDPAQAPAYSLARNSPEEYKAKVAEIVKKNPSVGFERRLKDAIKRGEFRSSCVLPSDISVVLDWSTAIKDPTSPATTSKHERQRAKPSNEADIIDISDGSDGLGEDPHNNRDGTSPQKSTVTFGGAQRRMDEAQSSTGQTAAQPNTLSSKRAPVPTDD